MTDEFNLTPEWRKEQFLANAKAAAAGTTLPYTITPAWRIEHFWNNVIVAFQKGTLESLTAITRTEKWLTNIVDAIKGNTLTYTLTPEWRVEMWAKNVIDAIQGNNLTYSITPEWRSEAWYADIITTIQSQQPTSAIGEWLWNEELAVVAATKTYAVAFDSFDDNGNAFSGDRITISNKFSGIIKYTNSSPNSSVNVYIGEYAGWQNSASRSITITGGDDVENADFLAYLTANATRVS